MVLKFGVFFFVIVKMETSNQKTIERMVSQRALQMGNSFPCQICVVGFLSGVCLTSLLLAALTSFEFGGISSWTSSSQINMVTITDHKLLNLRETERWAKPKHIKTDLLISAWEALLIGPEHEEIESSVPNAPHLQNCKSSAQVNKRLDTRAENESFPPWTSWKGSLDTNLETTANKKLRAISNGAYPPWVMGSDEENYPLTRKVQRDIWRHQHPVNCRDPNVTFLVADWERIPGFGIGAQIAGMCALLAVAMNEKRVLITNYYNRADHDGCKGSSRGSWSCYFFPETSEECRERAFELMASKDAWENGIVKAKDNYTSRAIWTARPPKIWGDPWSYLQPTTDINGRLMGTHRKMDLRWWRAQAIRYLMRFQTEYTCGLLNVARHAAFGDQAATMVLKTRQWPPKETTNNKSMEEFVWSSEKPWVPRPLLSMHVRMGDKACEMKVVDFKGYMQLAHRIRRRFPHLNNIWLSTEMQEVIDKTKEYPHWNFYYTNVTRQVGNTTMATYEASLGRETSTNYPLVNFLMGADADFFIGALGSTWCYLIDGMRNTGGKVMAGYLSVNKDRFW